ncbi:hypothetical protein SLA2020_111390 [Shorea laevis]
MLMLERESQKLPVPRQPTYTSMRSSIGADFYLDGQDIVSSNDVTVTMVSGRQIVLFFPLHRHQVINFKR